jgi:hypothetical protein
LTLIEHYDGTNWSVVSSPNSPPYSGNDHADSLTRVTCIATTDCWAVGYYLDSNSVNQNLIEHYTVPAVQVNAIVSRKNHVSAGTFDIDLPLTGNPGIECRSGGANGDYQLVFTFANTLTNVESATVTAHDPASGTGTVSGSPVVGPDAGLGLTASQCAVNLTNVSNAQYITVSLTNVSDSVGNFSSAVSVPMGVLLGDVNANRLVNSTDTSLVQAQSGKPVTLSNFRMDVNANGLINSTDTSIVQSKSGTGLP